MKIDLSAAKKLVKKYRAKKGVLIPLLQDVQASYGYVPAEVITLIAKEFGIYPVDVYGILTFYAQFYLTPQGKHIIKVCQGTACHVMGGKELLDYVADKLGAAEGKPTKDGLFSLERVACLGCCGMAPAIVVDQDFYGRCTIQTIKGILDKYRPSAKRS
ncbi:MAG: NADH dehydrogenase [Elusimicrobia bacterium RIFOXYA12_FULL_51_18]|nr:MAG: NADH dehydrogenase [Elusimicrobia bacterium RIFOXYA12_FULL_51_18]OGS31571.1 MAG: NADH dehydrogenase [Elusimicrobia bacterium RIFOXYA2_FULL_53_38]